MYLPTSKPVALNLASPLLISKVNLIRVPFTVIVTYPVCIVGTLTVISESFPYTTLVAVTFTNDTVLPIVKFWLA